jgi:hypothetical protein
MMRMQGTAELRNSGTAEQRNSGTEELRNRGTEELRTDRQIMPLYYSPLLVYRFTVLALKIGSYQRGT